MPKKGFTEIVAIVDRSGSMQEIRADAMGGFNAFLADQQQLPGEATMTVVLFDHEYIVLHSNVKVQDIAPLDKSTYIPRGQTALYDAIGRAVNEVKGRIDGMAEADKPEGVIFAILTDGMENASAEFDKDGVTKMITEQQKEGREFAFLAAGQDAFELGRGIGIKQQAVANFVGSAKGVRAAFSGVSHYAAEYRSGGSQQLMAQNCSMQNMVDDAMSVGVSADDLAEGIAKEDADAEGSANKP